MWLLENLKWHMWPSFYFSWAALCQATGTNLTNPGPCTQRAPYLSVNSDWLTHVISSLAAHKKSSCWYRTKKETGRMAQTAGKKVTSGKGMFAVLWGFPKSPEHHWNSDRWLVTSVPNCSNYMWPWSHGKGFMWLHRTCLGKVLVKDTLQHEKESKGRQRAVRGLWAPPHGPLSVTQDILHLPSLNLEDGRGSVVPGCWGTGLLRGLSPSAGS